jgi:sugar lactone lactonase YvrE
MKRRLTLILASVLLLALLAAGAAAATPARTCTFTPSLVATFAAGDYGAFAEGMAADSHGQLLVSLTTWGDSNTGAVWRVGTHDVKTLVATLNLGPGGMLMGVAVDRTDRVYVVTADFGDPQVVGSGVYRVGAEGSVTKVVTLPAGAWPNGLAFHDGLAYITDSAMGAVWRAHIGSGVASPSTPWLQDAVLAASNASGIGANGIAFRNDRLFVSVSDHGLIVRIPEGADGSAGAPRVICRRPELKTADGIACDALGGIWITTNEGKTGTKGPSGGLYRLSRVAGLQKIADNPGWLNYPTTPVFGTTPGTLTTLYVENGAYFSAYGDGTVPDIQALHVGVPGLPLR